MNNNANQKEDNMCTFMQELPRQSKTAMTVNSKKNMSVTLRECKGKDLYRFRLLNFLFTSKNDRDFPFIEKWVHEAWEDVDGKRRMVGQITCPVTKFSHFAGDPYKECPCCKVSNSNYMLYKNSGFKDSISRKNAKASKRKYQACIPVYVVNNPNYEMDNGKFKVLILQSKDDYKKFLQTIHYAQQSFNVFNGKAAVDFWLSCKRIQETVNQGKPNEFTYSKLVIENMGFSNKPYDISQINKENIDAFPFDDDYYTSASLEELTEFSKAHYLKAAVNTPENDINITDAPPMSGSMKAAPASPVLRNSSLSSSEALKTPEKINEAEVDSILKDGLLPPEAKPVEIKAVPPEAKTEEPEAKAEQPEENIGLDNIDELINSL